MTEAFILMHIKRQIDGFNTVPRSLPEALLKIVTFTLIARNIRYNVYIDYTGIAPQEMESARKFVADHAEYMVLSFLGLIERDDAAQNLQ